MKKYHYFFGVLFLLFSLSIWLITQSKNPSLNTLLYPSTTPAALAAIPSASPLASPTTDSTGAVLGTQTKFQNCTAQGVNPDPACTPGAVFPNVTKDQICVSGYSSGVRNVTTAEKDQIYAEYGITQHTTGEYEVDHFISLELGGSNDPANLWPEPAAPTPGFHEKDKVENYLHQEVCDGKISLPDAQYQISHDWLSVYQQIQ